MGHWGQCRGGEGAEGGDHQAELSSAARRKVLDNLWGRGGAASGAVQGRWLRWEGLRGLVTRLSWLVI